MAAIRWLALFAVAVARYAAPVSSQESPAWTVQRGTDDGREVVTASVIARSSPGQYRYEFTMRCDGTTRQARLGSAPPVADTVSAPPIRWYASEPDSSRLLAAIRIAFGTGSPRSVLLRRTQAEQGLLILRASPLGGATGEALSREIGRSADLLFGDVFTGIGMPGRVTILDLAPGEQLALSFDSLPDGERKSVQDLCFARQDRRAEQDRCLQEARRRAAREMEAQFDEVRRDWCESTRRSRRDQLLTMFVASVRQARNGGEELATALTGFVAANPDVIIATTEQSTQSCSDRNFAIDTTRLFEALKSPSTGQGGEQASKQRISYLLAEGIVITRTTQFKLEPPMPSTVSTEWETHVREAEAACRVPEPRPPEFYW